MQTSTRRTTVRMEDTYSEVFGSCSVPSCGLSMGSPCLSSPRVRIDLILSACFSFPSRPCSLTLVACCSDTSPPSETCFCDRNQREDACVHVALPFFLRSFPTAGFNQRSFIVSFSDCTLASSQLSGSSASRTPPAPLLRLFELFLFRSADFLFSSFQLSPLQVELLLRFC